MKRSSLVLFPFPFFFFDSFSLTSASTNQIAFQLQDQESSTTTTIDIDRRPSRENSTSISDSSTATSEPTLHGKFLHITDLHPDPYYKVGSAVEAACHWDKPGKNKKKGKQRAGYWGTGPSECDSPPRLITASLDWISSNWLPSSSTNTTSSSSSSLGIDFIIWTGDSARHDIDNKLPRSSTEIFNLNLWTLNQIKSRFPSIPIIPTLGNNDIFPHNILFKGPNSITKNLYNIWKDFIPEYQIHTFQYGAYFSNEVIKNQLVVISLNTIFWFNNNKVVDGCRRKGKGRKGEDEDDEENGDPGRNQLNWLEVQLEIYRNRKMQVHLIGHVPPSFNSYYENCFNDYTDLVLRFQDTIVGQHFGHANIDVFYLQEEKKKRGRKGKKGRRNLSWVPERSIFEKEENEIEKKKIDSKGNPNNIIQDLKDSYESIPGRKRTDLNQWNYFFVAPSIVPTSFPSVRIWTYNTSLESKVGQENRFQMNLEDQVEEELDENENLDEDELFEDLKANQKEETEENSTCYEMEDVSISKRRKKHNSDKKKKKKKRKKERKPRFTSPNSPSRSNTYLSLLGYSQWTSNIKEANEKHDKLIKDLESKFLLEEKNDANGIEISSSNQREFELEEIKKKESLEFRLEYSTYRPEVLWREVLIEDDENQIVDRSKESFDHIPVPKHLLEKELNLLGVSSNELQFSNINDQNQERESKIHHDSQDDHDGEEVFRKVPQKLEHFTDYRLTSINVETVLHLARRLVNDDEMWKKYKRRIYSSVE